MGRISRRQAGGGAIVVGGFFFVQEALSWLIGRILDVLGANVSTATLAAVPWTDVVGALCLLLGAYLSFVPAKKSVEGSEPEIEDGAHTSVAENDGERIVSFPTYPAPDWEDPLTTTAFGYAYPKAVLKAAIEKPRGTREARSGSEAHKMSLVMQVTADHREQIYPCSAILHGYTDGESWTPVDEEMRLSQVVITPKQPKHVPFLKRDLSDEITPEPFLLLLKDREIPLKEKTSYTLIIELVCSYPLPTVITVHLQTGEGLNAIAEIIGMELAETKDGK